MRVVFDTNVLVAAARSRHGASFALVSLIPSPEFELSLSVGLHAEWQEVLSRPENLPPGEEDMSSVTIELPDSLKNNIEALAAKEGYTVSQFLASAAGEKLAVVLTMDYLRREASASRREDFEKYLAAIPDGVPPESDRID